jgi:hypothetical protein
MHNGTERAHTQTATTPRFCEWDIEVAVSGSRRRQSGPDLIANPVGSKNTELPLAFRQIPTAPAHRPNRIREMGLKRFDAQIGVKFGLINNISGITIMLALRAPTGRRRVTPSRVGAANPAI